MTSPNYFKQLRKRFGTRAKDLITRFTVSFDEVKHYGRGYQSLNDESDRYTFNESQIEESYIMGKDDE